MPTYDIHLKYITTRQLVSFNHLETTRH